MTTIVGRNIKVEVALTFDSAINPTDVSKASPGVATLSTHAVETGDVGYWSVTAGMTELHEQAVYCTDTDTNTFTLNGLDTTNYSTYSAGSLVLAATWGVVTEAYTYSIPDAAAAELEDTRLSDIKTRNIAGLLGSQNLTIGVRSPVTMSTALAYIYNKGLNGGQVLVKITDTTTGKVLRVGYGTPSIPGEDVSAGAGATGSLNIIVPQFILKPNT